MRAERSPLLVEAITYRFRGHSAADPEEYRTKDQVAEWRKRDPIPSFAGALGLDEDEAKELDKEAVEPHRRGGDVRRLLPVPGAGVAV